MKNNINNVMVSICAIAYNHEKYIEKTIKSFLKQKVSFNYEIIIHDDLSTDNTRKIIDKYKKEDDKIRVIYQKRNQYSLGSKILPFLLEKARGKYIALCECDDSWIDPYKLQKQIDFLEENQEYSYSISDAIVLNEENNTKTNMHLYKNNKTITVRNYSLRKPAYPIASLVFRRKFSEKLPKYYYNAPVGDLPLEFYLLTMGKGYYFKKPMVLYRKFSFNSWSVNVTKSREKMLKHNLAIINTYKNMNIDTNGKYKVYLEILLFRRRIKLLLSNLKTLFIKLFRSGD